MKGWNMITFHLEVFAYMVLWYGRPCKSISICWCNKVLFWVSCVFSNFVQRKQAVHFRILYAIFCKLLTKTLRLIIKGTQASYFKHHTDMEKGADTRTLSAEIFENFKKKFDCGSLCNFIFWRKLIYCGNFWWNI